jgi:hypothetical protein
MSMIKHSGYVISAAMPVDEVKLAIKRDENNFGQCPLHWKSKKQSFPERGIYRDSYKSVRPVFKQVTRAQFRVQFLSGHWTCKEVALIFGKSRETVRGWLGKNGLSDLNHVLPISFDDLLKLASR